MPALDGVRGFAVLVVMVFHFTVFQQSSLVGQTMLDVLDLGWAGVDIFFVLSGFLITGILLDSRGSNGFFRNFYARRTLRIFPLYYAFLIVVLYVWPFVRDLPMDPFSKQLWMLTYLGNIPYGLWGRDAVPGHTTHLWSLAIEEQFYLIWPLVVYWLSRRSLLRMCVVLIVGAWITRWALYAYFPSGYAGYALLPARVDGLAAGALLAGLVRQPGWVERLRPVMPRLVLGGLILLLGTALWGDVFAPTERAFTQTHLRVQLFVYPAVTMIAIAMVLRAVLPVGRARTGILSGAVLRDLGKYGYALYLFHVPLRNLLVNTYSDGRLPPLLGSTMLSQLVVTLAGIAMSYVLAVLSWNLFEKHLLKLKRRFEYQPAAAAASLTVPAGAPEIELAPAAAASAAYER